MNPQTSDHISQGEVHSKYRDAADDDDEEQQDEMGTTDFAVTQDFSLMKTSSSAPPLTVFDESFPNFANSDGRFDGRDSTSPALDLIAPNLHEASV